MSETLDLIRDCEKSGVKMSVSGQNLKIDAPKGLPDSMKEALRQHKADIIRALTRKSETNAPQGKETPKTLTLTAQLNRMIAAGVCFDVGPDNFQTFGASERETMFLRENKTSVLCTLQQGFLNKHLFQNSPELLQTFTVEVQKLSAIISDGEPGINFEAVCQVTGKWISKQIEKL